MEDRPLPVQLDADAGARPLLDFGAAGQQEGLDVGPEETSGNRPPEDGLQRPAVPLSHADMLAENASKTPA